MLKGTELQKLSKETTALFYFYPSKILLLVPHMNYETCVKCVYHQSSVCAAQCEPSCDWRSTPTDMVGTSGRTQARRSDAAELEADGADTRSRSPPVHSQTQTYNNKHRESNMQRLQVEKQVTISICSNLNIFLLSDSVSYFSKCLASL